jgi:hypothetical protein
VAYLEDRLRLYEAVCYADQQPLMPRECRCRDLVLILRATTHERAGQIADEWLHRRLSVSEVFFCRSIRHIGYDLNNEGFAEERILHRFRKTLAINLGYPEWTRAEPDSPWVFVGPSIECDQSAGDPLPASPQLSVDLRRPPDAAGARIAS